jgi:hypothetical protein
MRDYELGVKFDSDRGVVEPVTERVVEEVMRRAASSRDTGLREVA